MCFREYRRVRIVSETKFEDLPEEEKERIKRHVDHARKWIEIILRHNFLINAGGAIATLGFMGATWATGSKTSLLPLSCFVFGIIFAGLGFNGELIDAVRRIVKNHLDEAPDWFAIGLKNGHAFGSACSLLAFFLFVLGSLSGLVLLALG